MSEDKKGGWEYVDHGDGWGLFRYEVPGGWLYSHEPQGQVPSITFVPDPQRNAE